MNLWVCLFLRVQQCDGFRNDTEIDRFAFIEAWLSLLHWMIFRQLASGLACEIFAKMEEGWGWAGGGEAAGSRDLHNF